MAFEQALVTPSEQTQQRWAHTEKGEERNVRLLFHHLEPLGSVSRYPARTQQGTGRRLHANGNVPHHSAVICTLTQSQTDHGAAEMQMTAELKLNFTADLLVWNLRFQRLCLRHHPRWQTSFYSSSNQTGNASGLWPLRPWLSNAAASIVQVYTL